eukprot:gene27636-33374_t
MTFVQFDFDEEKREKHPTGKRALLVPHHIPYSTKEIRPGIKDEILVLGSLTAIIKTGLFEEISVLYKLTDHGTVLEPETNHRQVIQDYVARNQLPAVTIRSLQLSSNHSFTFWKDEHMQALASQFDGVFFVGADQLDGRYGCSNTHHLVRLMYCAAKGAPTVVMNVDFSRKLIEKCQPTMRFLRALLSSNVNTWVMLDSSSYRDVQSLIPPDKPAVTKFRLGGDLGLLAPYLSGVTDQIHKVVSHIEVDKMVSRRIIGVNINLPPNRMALQDPIRQALVRSIAQVNRRLERKRGVSVVYVPFDYTGEYGDAQVAEKFAAVFKREVPELATSIYTFPSTSVLSSSEVREVLSHVDILLTTRLPMAVAAISTTTPALVLGTPPSLTSALGEQIGIHNMSASVEDSYIAFSLYKYIETHWGNMRKYRAGIKANAKALEDWVMKNVMDST